MGVTHQQIIQGLMMDGKPRQENVKDYSLDPDKVKRWLDSYEPQERKIANYLIKNTRHISWTEFRHNLIRVNTDIIKKIKGRFCLFMPSDNKNSVFYFASLVYENVIFPNPRCLTADENSLGRIISESRSETNILYCDDMSYSGSQLSDMIIEISNCHSPNFFNFIEPERTSTKDIPIYCAGKKRKEFFSLYFNAKLTLDDYNLASMEDALILYQNERWIVLRRQSSQNKKLKIHMIKSWYGLKEFLEQNRSLYFRTVKMHMFDVELKYITPAIFNMKPINIYLGIPYFTTSSLDSIFETIRPGITITFGKYERIPTIGELYKTLPHGKQQFMFFLATHFNFYFPTPLQDFSGAQEQDISEMFNGHPDANPKLISLAWFDHKLADPISTISVILGCGLVIPYTSKEGKLVILGEPRMLGSLLKNCEGTSQAIMKKRQTFLQKFYSSKAKYKNRYTVQDKYACGNCPRPFYKDP